MRFSYVGREWLRWAQLEAGGHRDGERDVAQLSVQHARVTSVFELLQQRPSEIHEGARLVVAAKVIAQLVQALPDGEQTVLLGHDDGRGPFLRWIPADLVLWAPLDQSVRRTSGRRRVTDSRRQPKDTKLPFNSRSYQLAFFSRTVLHCR